MVFMCNRFREIEHTSGYYEEIIFDSGNVNNDCIGISTRAIEHLI